MAKIPSGIQAAVFDLDGTLLDTEPLYYNSYAAVAADFGKPYSFDVVHRFLLGRPEHIGAGEFLRILGIDGVLPDHLLHMRDEYFLKALPEVVPLPGAVEAVTSFRSRNVKLALATSSSREYLPLKRKHNEALFAPFDHILCGTDPEMAGKPGKPHPAIFLSAAASIGVPPEQCVAFEDSIAGVASAKAAGMHVIMVPDGRLTEAEVQAAAPHCVLASLSDFHLGLVGL